MVRVLGWIVGLASVMLACSLAASASLPTKSARQQRSVSAHKTARKPPCYQHYRAAHVAKAVQPVTPQIALADGVTGTVEVMVTVRASGAVVGAEAISGPALLRQAAVDAALATTFVPEIRDCHAIPGAYSYFVDFSGA